MVSISHDSRSRTGRCEKILQGFHGFKPKQRQELNRRSSFVPKFVLVLFIALMTRVVFFLPVDKFRVDDFSFHDFRDQQHYARNGFRGSTVRVFESDGKEVEKSTRKEKKSLGEKERSITVGAAQTNKGVIYAAALNAEEHENVTTVKNTVEDVVEMFGNARDSEEFQQVDRDQNSADDQSSADSKNSEEEAVHKLFYSSDMEAEDRSHDDDDDNDDDDDDDHHNNDDDMYFRNPNATVADWPYFPSSRREPRRDPSWTNAAKSTSALFALNENECDLFMNNIDTAPPPIRKASGEACDGYDGVFQINHYDEGGASGTAFFLFTIGMLAWADQHNYLPWIHIEDNYTEPIWDPIVHTNITGNQSITFEMLTGMEIGWARDPDDPRWHLFPGRPFRERDLDHTTFVIEGTGVWEHYFLPPNDFVPGDPSCRNKPIIKMNDDHIVPGMHSNAPWAPRAWRYVEAPNILLDGLSWDLWFEPQRKRGAEITERYIRFNPMMERRAYCAFPNPEFSLGMHIRHGDKFIERDVIQTDKFLAFAEAFVNNGGGAIFIATDSSKVIETILKDWPKHVADHVVHQSSVQGLTSNGTAAFNLGISSHRTNVEALTDVLALSKSTFFLHGLSAMSEAVLYLNPGLVARSINLEDEMYSDYRPEDFVESIMPLGRSSAKQ